MLTTLTSLLTGGTEEGSNSALEARLQRFVAEKNLPLRVTVVTGPSGSYREHDILNFLERHLGEWGPGSKWELFFADAYAPGLTDSAQRFCWLRGCILIIHGGGASSVGQTNDTDLHLWTRKRFISASCINSNRLEIPRSDDNNRLATAE